MATAALWVLSVHGAAVWLARNALPQFEPATAALLQARQVQAVVVLGGGVLPSSPEYGPSHRQQLSGASAERLRYGIWLARQTGLPLAFSGGKGWAASTDQIKSEAEVAWRAAQEWGATVRWQEGDSRDTAENARLMAALLGKSEVTRIALVTHAAHMPRALSAFRAAGLSVTPAPMGFISGSQATLLEWLPSARGLQASTEVCREILARAVSRMSPANN